MKGYCAADDTASAAPKSVNGLSSKADPLAGSMTAAADVLGVKVHTVTATDILQLISSTIDSNQRAKVFYLNTHGANLAYETPWFRDCLNASSVVFCDGYGVKWAARILGQRLPERFTPPDWLPRLARLASERAYSIYLLGGRPAIAERAAAMLRERYPQLTIAGTHHGYFDKQPASAENTAVISAVNAARPRILLVGFGMPLQERWLTENWDRLGVNVALTVGALLDYVAGTVPRGPRWMTDNGLEWLARLIIEPRRLWRRYVVGNPVFIWRVVRQRLRMQRRA